MSSSKCALGSRLTILPSACQLRNIRDVFTIRNCGYLFLSPRHLHDVNLLLSIFNRFRSHLIHHDFDAIPNHVRTVRHRLDQVIRNVVQTQFVW